MISLCNQEIFTRKIVRFDKLDFLPSNRKVCFDCKLTGRTETHSHRMPDFRAITPEFSVLKSVSNGKFRKLKLLYSKMATRRKYHKMDETFDQMVKDLVCQLCEGYPNPDDERWYKCSDHHHICQSCVESEKMEKCSFHSNLFIYQLHKCISIWSLGIHPNGNGKDKRIVRNDIILNDVNHLVQ